MKILGRGNGDCVLELRMRRRFEWSDREEEKRLLV